MFSRRRKFLLTLGLFAIGLAIGGACTFFLRDAGPPDAASPAEEAQPDPCYGHGELIFSWTYTVDAVNLDSFREDLGITLTPGEEREVRRCQESQFVVVTIDGPTGVELGRDFDYEAAKKYYAEHPEELPGVKVRATADANYAQSLEPADIPTDLTAPCDPSWVETTFEKVAAAACHPADWVVAYDNDLEGGVGTTAETVQVAILGLATKSHNTTCLSPTLVTVPSGMARACSTGPNPTPYARTGYGIILPDGRNVAITIFNDATAEEEAIALRVAANIQSLP